MHFCSLTLQKFAFNLPLSYKAGAQNHRMTYAPFLNLQKPEESKVSPDRSSSKEKACRGEREAQKTSLTNATFTLIPHLV